MSMSLDQSILRKLTATPMTASAMSGLLDRHVRDVSKRLESLYGARMIKRADVPAPDGRDLGTVYGYSKLG